ncbi:MAG: SDR family NAD(P)-dependent oxidoreductase [Bdellovibrionota bacterium]
MKEKMGRRKFVAGSIAAGVVASTGLKAEEKTEITKPLSGQTALVTGGARGIGRACALELAKLGANIVIFDLPGTIKSLKYKLATQKDMDETLSLVRAEGVKASGYKVDIRDLASVKENFSEALSTYGKIQIAVVNAGIKVTEVVTKISEESWKDVIDVNLTGSFHTIQVASQHMVRENYGRIVAIGSSSARSAVPQAGSYIAAKWGLIGLVKATALELGKSGVTVNVVNPAITLTDLSTSAYPLEAMKETAKKMNVTNAVFLETSETARMVGFLAMKESANISGATFDVAAGQSARWP